MKNKLLIASCALVLSLSPAKVFSQASQGVETRGSNNYTQPSVNAGANKTNSSNRTGQIMSYLTGGIFITKGTMDIKKGSSNCPGGGCALVAMGVMEVALGVLSMKQGSAHGGSAGQAGFTGIQTDGYAYDPGTGNLDPLDPNNPKSPLLQDPTLKAAMSNLKDLQNKGILDLKKGTITAGGKTYKVSDFSSAGSMAAAGLPKGAIDGAYAFADAASKKAAEKMEKIKLGAMTAASGYEEGGGAGGGAGVASDGVGDTSYAGGAGVGENGKIGIVRDPAALAGMQKNYNGEPIGVAADSIFLMMNRRYKVKESQESFFTDAELALQK